MQYFELVQDVIFCNHASDGQYDSGFVAMKVLVVCKVCSIHRQGGLFAVADGAHCQCQHLK